MDPDDPPVLVIARIQYEDVAAFPAPVVPAKQLTTDSWRLALLVKVPKRPNTKPAIAMAAISVMAMSMTVARTGEIAFLRLALLIFNLDLLYLRCYCRE